MDERLTHPDTERLQAFVEETLDAEARASVETHLSVCQECASETVELRSLFLALAELPRFSPSAGFADRVMMEVRVRRPVLAGAEAWLERVTPRSTHGWAAAAALLALPVVGASLLVAWVMSRPGVTLQGLWTLAGGYANQALASGWQWAWTRFAGTNLAAWLAQAADVAGSVGHGEIGLAAVLFGTLTVGSIYVLYQNLFRPEARRTEHASYVF